MGLKFRRQASIGGFIVDFYCPSLRLAIEVDGSVHRGTEAEARDRDRDHHLAATGIRVIRLSNDQVSTSYVEGWLSELSLRPPSPYHGEGDRG